MRLSPIEAANHYAYLEATAPLGHAASFSREYEDGCSEEEFDAYLRYCDDYATE